MSKPNCECIEKANKALAEQGTNTRLVSLLEIDLKTKEIEKGGAVLATEKIDSKSRKPKATIQVSYCPICGKAYGETTEDTEEGQ